MMSTYHHEYYSNACEFTVPIKLKIPILIEPTLVIQPVEPVREKVNIHLEPDIHLRPEVSASSPVCVPQNGYSQQHFPVESNHQ
ncbi:hypothetical protein [Tolypothrix sp. PCC 7910]|uniref:hypothetical protein n=1 Tax=Tolypothrix sp. PCC 7910 TaxID=2099387 RepID=UPI001FCAA137|nr:hypothetical protein [Tolypothrix sp. PCC 7910]